MSNVRSRVAQLFAGSGPGEQTSDGCSVDVYRLLPYRGELEPFAQFLPPGTTVLELGCGTGRLTQRLLELGCTVTAVDSSAEMLAHVPPAATTALSPIETLQLEATFDLVLLASNLINHPLADTREAFVRSARAHSRLGGRILVERHDPLWLSVAQPGSLGSCGEVHMQLEAHSADAAGRSCMTISYAVRGGVWRQSFVAEPLTEPQVEALLAAQGYAEFQWHGATRRWVSARALGGARPNPSIERTPNSTPRYTASSLSVPRGVLSVAAHVER